MKFIYNENETMRLLGKQSYGEIYGRNQEAYKGIKEIQQARMHEFTVDAAFDIFMLGYIYGKRAERKRRRHGKSLSAC